MVLLTGTGKTRQCNICSHNHRCHGKVTSIKYFEYMSVFLPKLSSMQSIRAILYLHICGLSSSTTFFHMVS